jgi:hypothetical protein
MLAVTAKLFASLEVPKCNSRNSRARVRLGGRFWTDGDENKLRTEKNYLIFSALEKSPGISKNLQDEAQHALERGVFEADGKSCTERRCSRVTN